MDDYSEGAHPALLKALITSNTTQETGYGGDTYCDLARQRIRRHLGQQIPRVPGRGYRFDVDIRKLVRPPGKALR